MEFATYGIDRRLVDGVSGLRERGIFHEKLLEHVLRRQENVLVRIGLTEGRQELLLLPAIAWILGAPEGETRRALVVAADDRDLEALLAVLGRFEAALPAELAPRLTSGVLGCVTGSDSPCSSEGPGEAKLALCSVEALVGAETAELRGFGLLVLDGAERVAELPPEPLRKLVHALGPSWERRSLIACSKISAKAKNLAWELADNPVELRIETAAVVAQGVAQEAWHIATEEKLRFLLGLLAREAPKSLCVFCNLRDSAEELSLRLNRNGQASECLFGTLSAERKAALRERLDSGALRALILTDEGAAALPPGGFQLLVNYEIPLEPEYYVRRLEMLDRSSPEARVVNLACDRYVYGLPAVERHIGASLAARPVDPALLAAEDDSAGLRFERPRSEQGEEGRREGRSGGVGRQGRLVPIQGGGPESDRWGSSDRRGGNRNSANRRPEPKGRGRERGGAERDDRAPDIRRSIAEATGGSLGFEPPAQPRSDRRERSQAAERGRRAEPGGREGKEPRRGKAAPGASAGGQRQDKRQGERSQRDSRGTRRQNSAPMERRSPDRSADRRGQPGQEGQGNPYELSMEERLRRYREKYGSQLEGSEAAAPKKGADRRDPGVSPRPSGASSKPSPRDGGRKNGSAQRGKAPGSGAAQPPQRSDSSPAGDLPASGAGEPGPEGSGLLGRLFGVFRRKDE